MIMDPPAQEIILHENAECPAFREWSNYIDSLVDAMEEPAPKRRRLGIEAFVFQSTSLAADGTLWPPKLLQLVVNGDKHEVRCDGSQAHGNWMLLPDCLTITFHFKGGAKVKTSVFKHIAGTDAWLQVNCVAPWQGVLIPYIGGSLVEVMDEDV